MSRRFQTDDEFDALLYDGGFPLDFLRRVEKVGTVSGRGLDGSCQIEGPDYVVTAEPGQLIVRAADGRPYVLTERAEGDDDV